LAAEAGVNMQAIRYHFGDKDGLYQAAARRAAETLARKTEPTRREHVLRIAELASTGELMSAEEARERLRVIVEELAMALVDDCNRASSLFVVREQFAPTAAAKTMRETLLSPIFGLMANLTARVLGEEAVTEATRLRVMSLLGSVLVFRLIHDGAMAELGWDRITEARKKVMRRHVASLLDDLGRGDVTAGESG
jgi:AcrR family transcriptional regulator